MAKNDYRVYAAAYKNIVKNKIKVTGCKYDTVVEEIIENADDYKQCYKKGDFIREQLPRYWFISKEGFLLTVRNKKEPKWIKPNLSADRPEYKISKHNKNVTVYTLVALVWGSLRTKDAQKILDERGVHALGKLKKEDGLHVSKIQGHHIKNYIKDNSLDSYIANNDPSNIQIVTVREHDILNKLQDKNTDSIIFYQPKFMNVTHDEVVAFDIENARILDLETTEVIKVLSVTFLPLEKDSIITDKYIFISENNRAFLEEHKHILDFIAEQHPPKYKDPRKNFFEVNEHTVFYQYK